MVAQRLLDGLHVVEDAVVGRLGDRQHPRLGGLVLDQRIGLDLGADALRRELLQRDRTDDAEMVAGGCRKIGTVPVIMMACRTLLWQLRSTSTMSSARHARVPDDLVGGGRAVGDEVQMVAVEDPRRVVLATWPPAPCGPATGPVRRRRCRHRRATCSRRRTGGTSGPPGSSGRRRRRNARAMPRVRAVVGIVDQRLEERRCQAN